MRKTKVYLVSLFILLFALTGCGNNANRDTLSESGDKIYKVGVTQYVAHPALDLDRQGFLAQMKEEGFIEGQNIEFDLKNSQGDPNLAKTIADKFVADKVDVILAITTPSSQAAAQATKGSDIPVVFIAVSDAVGSGLIAELDQPTRKNITGKTFPIAPKLSALSPHCVYCGRSSRSVTYHSGYSISLTLSWLFRISTLPSAISS
jgi:putative ABC transport system substrate-binding protein